MVSFKDNNGREWHLTANVPIARKIKEQLGVDILRTQKALETLSEDPITLVDVLWLMVKDQAEAQQVTSDDFGASLFGESIGAAIDAFVEALVLFSPPRKQKILRTMHSAGIELEQMLEGMADKQIPEAIKAVRDLTSGKASAGSQA